MSLVTRWPRLEADEVLSREGSLEAREMVILDEEAAELGGMISALGGGV